MRERITLTIDKNLLSQVAKDIDGYKIKNRSHAVELLILKAFGRNIPKKALVLAGGKGTRLNPITHEIPKPLIPLNGKPLMEYTLDLFRKFGIYDVIISIGFMGDKIKACFGDGKRLGLNIVYIEENDPLGTAGPLLLAKKYLNETFILCNADEIKDIDLADMYMFHKEKKSTATIALTSVTDPSAFGVAKLNGNRILEFVEKPAMGKAPSKLINSGLYIIEPEVIDYVREGYCMIETDIFPLLAKENKLFGYPFSGYWKSIGTFEQYEDAIKDLKNKKLG